MATTISERARICVDTFHQALLSLSAYEVLISPSQFTPSRVQNENPEGYVQSVSQVPVITLMENQNGRFNIWASSIGVFASPQMSMDHRVRTAPEIRDLVLNLLRSLHNNVASVQDTASKIQERTKEYDHPNKSCNDEQLRVIDQEIRSAIEDISENVLTLHRLTAAILRAGSDNRNTRAVSYNWTDEKGNDLSETWKEQYAFRICRHKFPECTESLLERLSTAMLARRKRLLYQQSHLRKITLTSNYQLNALYQVKQHIGVMPYSQQKPPSKPENDPQGATAPHIAQTPSGPKSTRTLQSAATTLDPTKLRNTATHSQKSSYSAYVGKISNLDFPRIPKADAQGEAICPLCFIVLPEELRNDEERWRKHIVKDIDPYVCLFEPCSCAQDLYDSVNDWIHHMRIQHRFKWICTLRTHKKGHFPVFNTSQDFELHLQSEHGGGLTAEQIALFGKSGGRPMGATFEQCPLCGFEAGESTLQGPEHTLSALEKHVRDHMIDLALKCIPEIDTEEITSDVASKGVTSSGESGHTIPKTSHEFTSRNFALVESGEWDRVDASLYRMPKEPISRDDEWGLILNPDSRASVETDAHSNQTPRSEGGSNLSSSHHTSEIVEDAAPTPMAGDIIIAIMGVTGCGKTTFVNHFSDRKLVISHGLESDTKNVNIVPCTLEIQRRPIFLVDTPGFDDTMYSDTDILREIALWLNAAHLSHIKLTGIIYLHRIIDVRIGGSGIKNLRMFRKLCGDSSLSSVVLATTMWDYLPDKAIGLRREQELQQSDRFWKPMIQMGSRVFRHDRHYESAREIIYDLISTRPVVLDIQRELVDEQKQLAETGAGRELADDMERTRLHYEKKIKDLEDELQKAIADKDVDREEMLADAATELQERLTKKQGEAVVLETTTDQLYAEMMERYEKEIAELRENHAHNLEKQKLELNSKLKRQYYNQMINQGQSCAVM